MPGGLSVYPGILVEVGPPEVWVAVAIDRRLRKLNTSMGYGPTAHDAEIEALCKLGVTPHAMRAVLALPLADDT